MAIFNMTYLDEAYKSKYSSYIDDDEESEKEDDSSKKVHHLDKDTLRKILTLIMSKVNEFPKLKKCCDFTDLFYKDHINDDGERESPIGEYYNSPSNSYIRLISGDTFSGYPNFKDDGKTEYEKDEKEFVKSVNDTLKERGIKAKFIKGYNENDEEIDFGVRSLN